MQPFQLISHYSVPDVELRSIGAAGEWVGSKLGVYKLHSEDEARGRVYRQRHDYNNDYHYLYRLFIIILTCSRPLI